MKSTYLVALISLISFGTVGATALPARADKINTQVINQSTTIDGNGNTVFQDAEQTNVQNDRGNRRRNKPGKHGKRDNAPNQDNYQEVNQNADIYGNDNYVEQNATQTNVQNTDNRRRNKPGRGHKRGHDRDDD